MKNIPFSETQNTAKAFGRIRYPVSHSNRQIKVDVADVEAISDSFNSLRTRRNDARNSKARI